MPFPARKPITQARRIVNEPDYGWASKGEFFDWVNDVLDEIDEKIGPLSEVAFYGNSGDEEVNLPHNILEVDKVRHKGNKVDFDRELDGFSYRIDRGQSGNYILKFSKPIETAVEVQATIAHYDIDSLEDVIVLPNHYNSTIVKYLVAQFNFKDAEPQVYQQQMQIFQQELMEKRREEDKRANPATSRVSNKFWE